MLLGCRGQLGAELFQTLLPLGDVIPLSKNDCDLSDSDALQQQLHRVRPQVIVNAAAYTAVDQAEVEPSIAHAVNTTAPLHMALWAQRHGALLVHFSSDYVFAGEKKRAYLESDSPRPLNIYGRTKWEADQAIMAHCERHLILRSSWLYGVRGSNFVKTVLALASQREQLQVVNDQWGSPTSVSDLAALTAHMVRGTNAGDPAPYGLYHACASGVTSWHGLACYVVECARGAGYPIRVAPLAIEPCPSDRHFRPAKRPKNSSMDTGRLKAVWGWQMKDWRDGVDAVLAQLL
jgi:dTDP-4-dehydrorhamnose reductase